MQAETVLGAEGSHRAPTGNWVVLIAAAAFVVGSFLPFVSLRAGAVVVRTTLYRQLVGSSTALTHVGTFFFLFGGAAALAIVSIIGIRLRDRSWAAPALTAGAAVWSVTWVGVLLDYLGQHEYSFLVGFWCIGGSLVLAVAGAIIALRRSGVGTSES